MLSFPKSAIQDFVETALYPLEVSFLEHGSFNALLPKHELEEDSDKRLVGPFMPPCWGNGVGFGGAGPNGGGPWAITAWHYVFGCQAPLRETWRFCTDRVQPAGPF